MNTINRFRSTGALAAVIVFSLAGCASTDDTGKEDTGRARTENALTSAAGNASAQSEEAIKQTIPLARVHSRAGRVVRLHGGTMATGVTPAAAADTFRKKSAPLFGAAADDLKAVGRHANVAVASGMPEPVGLMYDKNTGKYKFWAYRYAQARGGIPVYGSQLVTLVKNISDNPVVWAGSSLRDLGSFSVSTAATVPAVNAAKSVRAVTPITGSAGQPMAPVSALARYSQPELVIYAGVGDEVIAPRLATQYVGENDNPPASWRFIADATTGDILHVENLAMAVNVGGSVRGNVTQGPWASECADEVSTPFPYAQIGISGGSSSFTSQTGNFYLINGGTAPVTVVSPVTGQRISLTDEGGANDELTQVVTPPNRADFLHNQSNNQEFVRGEANAYVYSNKARDFLVSYLPDYPTIGTQTNFPVYVNSNRAGYCPGNAWYFWSGYILLCQQGYSVTNTAFGSTIYHEYGHHVVNMAGGTGGGYQGEYGEGMGDVLSMLITEEPDFARGWTLNQCGTPLRTADNDCWYDPSQYLCSSCGSEIHDCGRLISGIVWDIRARLMVTHPTDYRDILNNLVLSAVPLHMGTAIDSSIAVDFLNLDDDDGNLDNGTPHRSEICGGFEAHGISCPALPNANPCASYCTPPLVFSWSGSYQSGNLGTGAVCRETTQAVVGGNCGNLAGGRQLFVNGTPMTCNNQNWSSIPAPVNGGYCVTTTAGNYPWAFFTLW